MTRGANHEDLPKQEVMTTPDELPDVLTVKEAAELLHFSPNTIRRKAGNGEIPGLYTGVWRFSRQAIMDALADCTPGRGRNVEPVVLPKVQRKKS